MKKMYRGRLEAMEEALEKHMPEGMAWTQPEGGMSVWVTLPTGIDAAELLIHVRERGVIFVPGRFFYFQHPQPNTLRLGFAALDEKQILRGIQSLAELLKIEFRKRQRGARNESLARVALSDFRRNRDDRDTGKVRSGEKKLSPEQRTTRTRDGGGAERERSEKAGLSPNRRMLALAAAARMSAACS